MSLPRAWAALACLALGALAPAAAGELRTADGCQPLTSGMNTVKGVLQHSPAQGAGAAAALYVLILDRPLCATGSEAHPGEHRMLALAIPDAEARRFVGRRVLVSGTMPARGPRILSVGSLAPLPAVAANVS